MSLIKNPDEVERIANEKDDENSFFRYFLKSKSAKEVDKIVKRLNESVTSQIDCTQCGNCCKKLNAAFESNEIKNVSHSLNVTEQEFIQLHCTHDEMDNIYYTKTPPCVFLKENKCTVYEKRPASCKEFPHLNKPNFIFRTLSVLDNYKICPIVFNVVELLKQHYNFRYKPKRY